MHTRVYSLSDLTRIHADPQTGTRRLVMAEITDYHNLPSFAAVRDHVLYELRFPTPQSNKLESYGFVPALYDSSNRTFTRRADGHQFTRFGQWRNGAPESDALSLFYADVDNADYGRPIVTMQEVANRLDAHGFAYFMYTSFSHTPEKPKFRVVIDTDRDLTRIEMLHVALWLNWTVLGQQADVSIYDPVDFVFAPPHDPTCMERLNARPLVVDAALAGQRELAQQYPGSWTKYVVQKGPRQPCANPTPEQAEALKRHREDRTVRSEMGIENPAVFNPAWDDFHRQRITNGSHYETMRSLHGMVWTKTDGALSYGEVDGILRQIDETDGGYFIRQHGEDKAAALIDWIMSLPVEVDQVEWHPLLERDESGLTVLVKEGECGQGKTRDELGRIAREKGRTVYVVDKISTIEQRRKEFFEIAGRGTAMRFRIFEAHSEKQECRVPLQWRTSGRISTCCRLARLRSCS